MQIAVLRRILLFLIVPASCLAQEADLPEKISSIAEQLSADDFDPGAADIFADRLYDLTEDPVKINSGDEEEISRLFFLTGFQVRVIADYVKRSGRIVSPYEIANIPGFDKETTEMMIPFITYKSTPRSQSDTVFIGHSFLTNLIVKPSSSDTSLPGSPWKVLTRYRFRANSFSGGFGMEKDPGERLFSGKFPVMDFCSGFLSWQGSGIIKKVVIGDYSARFGQGTAINSGIRSSLSLTLPGYLAGKNEIRPYTSSDVNNFFRGLAAEFSFNKLDLSVFFSSKGIDATLNDEGTSITSLYKTGIHNSRETILKKDAAGEISYGMHFSYSFSNLRTGILWTENRYSLPLIPDKVNPTDLYAFKGERNTLYSIYYNYLFKRLIFFGEFTYTGLKAHAFVQGLSLRPADRLTINLLYRQYSSAFVSFHSNESSGSSGRNETAVLGNFIFEAAKNLFISAGSEIRYFPWLRYRCSSPSTGSRNEINIKYLPSDRLSLETVFNSRTSMADKISESGIHTQEEVSTRSVRGSAKYSPAGNISFTTRIDYKLADPSGSKGTQLLQDINIRASGLHVSLWLRYSIFNTDGFESGIYTWENDLRNSFSIPVMYGSGSRSYIMVSWKPVEMIELRFKYALTIKEETGTSAKPNHEFKFGLKIDI